MHSQMAGLTTMRSSGEAMTERKGAPQVMSACF